MSRVLVPLTMLLLTVSVARAASLSRVASRAANTRMTGPTYRYLLDKNQSPGVCGHMLHVFNDKFTRPWDAPPMPWSKSDHDYSANSKYAFPLLPGVKHSTKATFEMRFSAQPVSPEFSAIHWKEGLGTPGGCPAGKICPGEEPQPILIAHFDFDNDGTMDTVIQQQSFRGYRNASDSLEYLIVWRNQIFTIGRVADIGELIHPKNQALTPIITIGMYFRPFIYAKQTYVAQYVQNLGEPVNANAEPVIVPWTQPPDREDMLVQQYFFTGQKQKITGRPEWNARTLCDFKMKQMSGR